MPVYKNSGSVLRTIGQVSIEPGQSVSVDGYLLNLPAGVALDTEAPMYNTHVISQILSAGGTVTIPETINGKPVKEFTVTLFAVSGQWSFVFNDAGNTPAQFIVAGIPVIKRVRDRVFKSIIVTNVASGVLLVSVDLN